MSENRTSGAPPRPVPPAAAPGSIAMVDVPRVYAELQQETERAVLETLTSGEYCLGSQVTRFEEEVASYLGIAHAVGVSSGTDALLLALTESGVGPGDEVITTAFTFIATATGIARLGAKPVFIDVERDGFQMDPDRAAAAIGPHTRAVIPVHLYGAPAPLEPFLSAARSRGIAVT